MKLDDLAGLRRSLNRTRKQREAASGTARGATSDPATRATTQKATRAIDEPVPTDEENNAASETDAFRRHVGDVAPVRARERVAHPVARPEPVPRQRELDERAALAATMSDDFDVETLLDTDDRLSFRRPGIGPDVPGRLRRGQWALQAEIDLHGLTRDEAREALADFVAQASQHGARCVRVVHGKGIGSPGRVPVLAGKVRAWLVQNERVIAFVQAPPAHGGRGALVVLLA